MLSSNGRASNRLVVGRGTDAGSGGRMPHSRSWRGVSRRVQLFAGLGLAVALLATFAALLAPPLQAQSTTEVEVPASWNLKPADLGDGDQFRLLFLSSTKRDGSSTDIAVYNDWIQDLVAVGHPNIRAYSAGFRVVGCTADVDARDNTGTTGTGVPIYWLDGNQVADDNADFYDGDWDDEANDKNESGNNGPDTSQPTNYPLTGCDHDGTEFLASNGSSRGLGAVFVRIGRPNDSVAGNDPLSSNYNTSPSSQHPMYGLSQVFTVVFSADATLSDLVLRDASNGSAITLDPGFALDHFEYAASVGFPVSQITVIPTKNDAGASIKYLSELDGELNDANTSQTGFQVNLAEGVPNVIKVEVTEEDGTATETYTLTVTRAVGPGQVLLSEKVLSLTEGDGRYYSVVLNRRPAANVTVRVRGHADTNVTPNPANLTFTTSNWQQLQWVLVSTVSDENTTNESVTLTHTAASSDSFFNGITIPSVIVNVDDQDAPDRHIRTITLPPESHELPPGEKPLPEEEIYPLVHLPPAMPIESGIEFLITDPSEQVFEHINVVASGHIWRPSGLWGEPGTDTMWVVDPSHSGIHPLKLSALKQGLIERHVAAGVSEFDQRLNYNCHFSEDRTIGNGNPSLTVMWGMATELWIANNSSGTLDVYDRDSSITDQCYTRNVTSWAADGQSYTAVDENFKSPFSFIGGLDLAGGPLTVRGIWAGSPKIWLSGPTGGVYTIDVDTDADTFQMDIAPGYDGHSTSYGLWSDGTTMWVATDSGWLRAYVLNSGIRSAEFDIRIQTYAMPPGDMWSDGDTIWVTNRTGKIDAYRLPDSSGGSSTPRATEADPLTASFESAPEAHDGENGFKLRIAFSDAVEITPEDMRDHALLVSGGTVTGAARLKDRSDLWELTVEPAGPGPVSILAPLDRACTEQGALCTADGRSLTAGPALVVPGPPAESPPGVPDQPEGTAVFIGGVDLEWNDVPGADSYEVQQSRGGQWTGLPADGVEVAFYGAGAIISGLDPEASLWFRVRAANGHGVSDWSEMLYMNTTSQFKAGRKARQDNAPASGAPVVHGTAQAGESLWADATGIEDGNGLDRVQFRYQWTSNDGTTDTDIAGATDSSYTLVVADVGKTIQVRVAFTDRGGYSETRTSVATGAVAAAPNNPATGAPAISGTAQVGQTLIVNITGIADADGLTNSTYSYQWIANDGTTDTDIAGATDAAYNLVADDVGRTVKVRVSFTDDAENEETLTSTATEAVAAAPPPDRPATGEPTITGTAQVGETLTVGTSGIADADGLTNVTYSYQWVANDGTTDTDISGATDATYTLVADDEGQTIKVRVTVTDDAGNETTLTSAATEAAAPQPDRPATGQPTISGTAQVGEMLTANTSGIADADGLTNDTYSYQWLGDDTDIAGATSSTYTLVAGDEGRTIRVRVTVTDDAENETTLTSAATNAVAAAPQPNSSATGLPTISGTTQVGETLTANTSGIADDDGLVNVAFAYQWLGDDADITGATASTYSLVAADAGKTIKVRVSFSDNRENAESLTSAATNAVEAAPEPPAKPTGLTTVVSHDAVTLAWDDPQDDAITGYVILRRDRAIHPVGTFVTITGDSGSADTTYTDDTVEPQKQYNYKIRAINEYGKVSKKSDWVLAYTPAVPVPYKPMGLSATVVSHDAVTLAWDDPQDDSITGYVILRRDLAIHPAGTLVTIAGDTGSADTTYTDDTVEPEKKYMYKIKAINEYGEMSEISRGVRADTPAAPPTDSTATGEPTISGTAQVGQTLSVNITGIADADGLTTSTYSYQWLSDDAEIGGATGSTYTLVAADEGRTIKVRVIVTDDLGNETTLTSAATEAVAAAPPTDSPATGEPTISGTAQVGQTLTVNITGIADADGLTTSTYSYQWLSDDAEIGGATGSTYTLVAADEGRTIKVRVIVTDDLGNETTLTSAATEAVAAAPQPDRPATGEPTISGTAQVGQTLTVNITGIADADGLTTSTYSYQWLSDDAEIGGATGSTYTLVAADEGRTIKVRVIVTDDLGNETTLTSAATEAVAAAPQPDRPATGLPTISGTAQVGQTLIVNITGIADADGLTTSTYSYQWIANDGGTDADISGATDDAYTLVAGDEGKTIQVRVSFTDDAENEETLTSEATGEVASGGPTEPPGPPLKLKGTANADGTVTLRWEAPDDDTVTGYQILRKRTSRGEQALLVHVNDTGSTATEYTDSDVTPDVLHAYRVKAINAVGLSKRSNVVKVTPVEPEQPSGNSAATGRPSIGGTPQVGEVLTADISGIGDDDGLTNVSYSYQWVVTDGGAYIDISGATGATYTLVAADRGLYIQVRVSFKDDAGNRETLTSALTEVVAAAP